jgi:hypothetical protein
MGQRSMDSSHHHAATALNQTRSDRESCCVGLAFGCVGKLTSGVGEGGNVFDSMDSNHHHVATALNQTSSDGPGSLTGWLCIEIVPHVLGAVVESWRLPTMWLQPSTRPGQMEQSGVGVSLCVAMPIH